MSKKKDKIELDQLAGEIKSLKETYTQDQLTSGSWDSYSVGPSTSINPHHHYVTSYPQQSYNTINTPVNELPTEGIDELCKMLGVKVTEKTDGVLLLGNEGKYSLVELISAQLKIMQKLHVLLVQTDLTPESGE